MRRLFLAQRSCQISKYFNYRYLALFASGWPDYLSAKMKAATGQIEKALKETSPLSEVELVEHDIRQKSNNIFAAHALRHCLVTARRKR